VLHALSTGALRTDLLITHRFPIEKAADAYELLSSQKKSLGILFHYPAVPDPEERTITLDFENATTSGISSGQPLLGVISVGNYASRVLIPAFSMSGARFHTLAANSGIAPVHFGRKFGFRTASTDVSSIFADPRCNNVVIATRHDSNAQLVLQALAAGKHVFVEKPLCLTSEELIAIEVACTGQHLLMVGFNRRFAPLIVNLCQQLQHLSGPKVLFIPAMPARYPLITRSKPPFSGGGRLLGEA